MDEIQLFMGAIFRFTSFCRSVCFVFFVFFNLPYLLLFLLVIFSACVEFFPPHLHLYREHALLTARRDPILTRERVYEPVRYPNVFDSYAEATKTPSFVGGTKVRDKLTCVCVVVFFPVDWNVSGKLVTFYLGS